MGGSRTVDSGATFAPGGMGSLSVGDFSVGGSFTLNDGGILAMQISGLGAGSVNLLTVANSATLGGTFNLTTLAFSPTLGNQFTFLTAASGVTGTFEATELPILDAGLAWVIHYNATSVSLEVVAALTGDYNQNGTVDAADYIVWRNNVGTNNVLANDSIGGMIGPAHYGQWREHFGNSSGSGNGSDATAGLSSSANATVPEPATAGMAFMGLVGLMCLYKRHLAASGEAAGSRVYLGAHPGRVAGAIRAPMRSIGRR